MKFKLKPKSIAVIELTLYPNWYPGKVKSIGDTDKVRGNLALQSINWGIKRGYRMVISDAGSSPTFQKELSKFSQIIFLKRQGETRAAGRRQGILAASVIKGVKVILRTEPEKVSIVKDCIPQISSPILRGKTDIVAPKRNPILFHQTYPKYMWQSEIAGNKNYNNLLHKFNLLPKNQSFDAFFGPIAFSNRPEILQLFLEKYTVIRHPFSKIGKYVNPEEWSNNYLFPVIKALYQGLKVMSKEINFRYPKEQKLNEETIDNGSLSKFMTKRKEQRLGFIEELICFIKYLHNDSKSGLKRIE